MSQDPDTLIQTLTQLDVVLLVEDEALRAFDLAGIARATEQKLALEERLTVAFEGVDTTGPTAWSTAQREQLASLRASIGARARANLRRLRASLGAVRSLVAHITGAPPSGYGRERANVTTARPVLASEIG